MQSLIFEEHHRLLAHLAASSRSPAVVVCLDAHLDIQRISGRRVRRFSGCRNAGDILALEKRHHLLPDGESSFSIEDFFYAAHRIGLIERLVWVAPPHVPIERPSEAVEQLREMDGVTDRSLDRFATRMIRRRPVLTGRLLGIPLTVCRLESLPELALPPDVVLDIDSDYLIELPGDRVWIDPQPLTRYLAPLCRPQATVTISRSVESGFTPIRFRFLADMLAACFDDDRARVKHFDALLAATRRLDGNDPGGARQLAEPLLAATPDCAATHFLLAQVTAGDRQRDHHVAAQQTCAAYRSNPLRIASEFPSRQIEPTHSDVKRLMEMARAACSRGEFDLDWVAATFSAVGILWSHLRRIDLAIHCFDVADSRRRPSSELALTIAKALIETGSGNDAERFLTVARRDDKTATSAIFFDAVRQHQSGRTDRARQLARGAQQRAPAWQLPRQLLRHTATPPIRR